MDASRTKKSATKEFSRKDCRTCLVMLIVLVVGGGLVLFYLGGALAYADNATYNVDISNEPSHIKITTARGERVTVVLTVGHTEEWASPTGIYLTLDGFTPPIELLAPIEPYWTNTYTVDLKNATKAHLTAGIPTAIGGPEERLMSGRLEGTVLTPADSTKIDIPIQLQLLSPESFHWSGGRNFFYLIVGFNVVVLGGVLIGYGWWNLRTWLSRPNRAEVSSAKTKRDFKQVLLKLVGALLALLVPTGIWALASYLLFGDLVDQEGYTDIGASIWLFSTMIGVLCLLLWTNANLRGRPSKPTAPPA